MTSINSRRAFLSGLRDMGETWAYSFCGILIAWTASRSKEIASNETFTGEMIGNKKMDEQEYLILFRMNVVP